MRRHEDPTRDPASEARDDHEVPSYYKPYRKSTRQWFYRTPEAEVEAGDNEEQAWAQARSAYKRDVADCLNPSLKSLAVNQIRQAIGVWPNAPISGGTSASSPCSKPTSETAVE